MKIVKTILKLKEKEIKNIKRASRFGRRKKGGSVQGFTWTEREFEGWNVEGSLKGGKKKKKKTLKPSGIAWENREFESWPPFYSTVSQ